MKSVQQLRCKANIVPRHSSSTIVLLKYYFIVVHIEWNLCNHWDEKQILSLDSTCRFNHCLCLTQVFATLSRRRNKIINGFEKGVANELQRASVCGQQDNNLSLCKSTFQAFNHWDKEKILSLDIISSFNHCLTKVFAPSSTRRNVIITSFEKGLKMN